MKTIAKTVTALTCAAVLAVGGLVTASAAPVNYSFSGATLKGTATKTTTTVTAVSWFTAKGSMSNVIYVRAYGSVNGSKVYGAGDSKATASSTDDITDLKYSISGLEASGYGGQHSLKLSIRNESTGVMTHPESGICTSSY